METESQREISKGALNLRDRESADELDQKRAVADEDFATVNETVRQIVRDRSRLDMDLIERRIKDALEELPRATN